MNKLNEYLYKVCTFVLYIFIFIATSLSFIELIIEFKYWGIIVIALVLFAIYYYFKYKEKQKDKEEERIKTDFIKLIDFSSTISDLSYSNFTIIKSIKLDYLRINIILKNNIAFEYKYSIKYNENTNFFFLYINLLDNLLAGFDWNNVLNMENYFINIKINDYINKNLTKIIKNNK